MDESAHVAVVLVNYRRTRDTIACLESLLRTEGVTFSVIVIDNGSQDDSLEQFRAWSEGLLQPEQPNEQFARRLTWPPLPKPIAAVWLDTANLEGSQSSPSAWHLGPLAFIRSRENLGFAGGNNVGLRLALRDERVSHVWLLNNDTLVEPRALEHMVRRLQERPDAGLCGSTLLFYDQPGRVQAFGGARYFPRLGLAMHVGRIFGRKRHVRAADIERQLDYVSGASMLVTREFLKHVGLMSEDYFLYYEEIDWALRARPDYGLAYAPDSVVYHRSGASIGSNRSSSKRSRLSEFYLQRSRLRFTRKFFPRCLLTVRGFQLFLLISRLMRLDWDRARVLLEAMRADVDDSRHVAHGH